MQPDSSYGLLMRQKVLWLDYSDRAGWPEALRRPTTPGVDPVLVPLHLLCRRGFEGHLIKRLKLLLLLSLFLLMKLGMSGSRRTRLDSSLSLTLKEWRCECATS